MLFLLLGATSFASANVTQLATITGKSADPGAIATDGTSLYIGAADSIYKMSTGGGSVSSLYSNLYPGQPYINGLTVMGSNLYFQNANAGSGSSTVIQFAPTSGGAVSTLCNFCPTFDGASLATDGNKLYSADYAYGTVGTYTPGFSSVFSGPFTYEQMVALAVGGGKGYVASSGTVTGLYSFPSSGGAGTLLLGSSPSLLNVNSMTYDNGELHWTNGTNTIFSMSASGGSVSQFTDAALSSLSGVTSLNGNLYVEGMVGSNTVVWSITPVPEPETYAMMLAGLGVLGFVARRRKYQAAESASALIKCTQTC
jgi:hypothetical protein